MKRSTFGQDKSNQSHMNTPAERLDSALITWLGGLYNPVRSEHEKGNHSFPEQELSQ